MKDRENEGSSGSAYRELLFLNEFTRQALSVGRPHELWPLLADHLAGFFNCERVTCFIREGDKLFSLHAQGLSTPIVLDLGAVKSKARSGIAAYAVESGKIYWTNAPHEDSHFDPSYDERTGFRTENVLAAPICHRRHILGAVELLNKTGGFTQEDAAAMEKFLPQAGLIFSRLQGEDGKKSEKNRDSAQIREIASASAQELTIALMNVLSTAQLASMRLPLESDLQASFSTIEAEANRCQRIISKLIQLAPPTSSDYSHVDLSSIASNTLLFLSKDLAIRGIQVERRLASSLPSVEADEFLLKEVARQLVSNAMLAMPGGGTLTVSTESDSNGVHLKVSDTGDGIPAQNLPYIFEPAFKMSYLGETANLELAACLSIVQSFGGILSASSEGPGRGSTFTLTLPPAP